MTPENKELLLKDLCARSLYDVIVDYEGHIYVLNEIDPSCKDIDYITARIQDVERLMCAKTVMIEDVKPYLRPMSSMTEEEVDKLFHILKINEESAKEWIKVNDIGIIRLFTEEGKDFYEIAEAMDYLHSIHIDYRGLIPKGLAIEVTEENNPYK